MKPEPQPEKPNPAPIPDTAWHAVSTDEALTQLETTTEGGLTSAEAKSRLGTNGYNQLDEAPPTTIWQMLWDQFNNFVIVLLIVAAMIKRNDHNGMFNEIS